MLMKAVDSYLAVRRAAGFKLEIEEVLLHSFARFAEELGDPFVRSQTAVEWAKRTTSQHQKRRRLLVVIRLARYLKAEEGRHEVPSESAFGQHRYQRPTPFIFNQPDILRLIDTVKRMDSLDSPLSLAFSTLFALLTATGLRISEALALRLDDISADGLVIRETKFNKSRLVPLHDTATRGLQHYLDLRRNLAVSDDHLFVTPRGTPLRYESVRRTFRRLIRIIGLDPPPGQPRPQLHSFRHTFAVRALQSCPDGRDRIAQHTMALSAYLGHTHVADTYWYFEATPQLMADIASAAQRLLKGQGS